MNLPYKFIVSASGSVELKEKIHESLIGRKRVFQLFTLSFEEFVNFKTNYKYENKLLDFFVLEKEKTKEILEEYLNFGGYPRLVLEDEFEEKQKIIDEIYQSYLERDIFYLLKLKKTEEFSNLVKLLASQIGNLVNFSEISSTLGISLKTLKHYLFYLQKTFIVQKISPYFRNVRKEITKLPVYYFYDLGLRNYSLGIFGQVKDPKEIGSLFENFVLNLLKEKILWQPAKIYFWRTKDGAEIDFILDLKREIIPIEVKYKKLKEPEIPRALKSFIKKYQPKRAMIINLELEKTLKIENTLIQFLPYYKVIFEKI